MRWLNISALGEWRTSGGGGGAPLHCFLWFLLRMSPLEDSLDSWFPVARVQRRVIHQIAQEIDEGLVQDTFLSDRIRLENAAGEQNHKLKAMETKQELLRRFLARNSGFCGTQNSANQDMVEAGLIRNSGKSNQGTVAAGHFVSVYWAHASEHTKSFMKTCALSSGEFAFPSLAIYHDASDVCGKEVARIQLFQEKFLQLTSF